MIEDPMFCKGETVVRPFMRLLWRRPPISCVLKPWVLIPGPKRRSTGAIIGCRSQPPEVRARYGDAP